MRLSKSLPVAAAAVAMVASQLLVGSASATAATQSGSVQAQVDNY